MYVISIDLGGTKIAGALMDTNLQIIKKKKLLTPASKGREFILKKIIKLIEELKQPISPNQLLGISVITPGIIDYENGSIIYATPHLKEWTGTTVRKTLEDYFSVFVLVENDGNASTFGEYWVRQKKSLSNMVLMTIGTGIGGGVIINEKLLRGEHGIAASLGHIPVSYDGRQCSCGQKGCVERYASGRAILSEARSIDSNIQDCQEVFEKFFQGEKNFTPVIEKATKSLGSAISTICNLYDPEAIFIGGGLSNQSEYLIQPVEKHLRSVFPYIKRRIVIKKAELGEEAGLYGGSALILQHQETIMKS